jgi:hypothetical protein
MTRLFLPGIVAAAVAAQLHCMIAQGEVSVSEKLPPASIELKAHDPPATSTPWQLPKPGDPLYNAKKEAEIKNSKQSHLVHVFERGVFKGYATLTSGPLPDRPAKEIQTAFTSNPKLPPNAVELSSSEHADKSDYFQTRPKTRPANVPADYILVRVFQGKKFIGWSYLPKDGVAALHKPK